ncbi:efflux RND transporter periplasmic adaptor subunit [Salegentibacter flavus]|uniref:Membrane fusion protein, Cu(I)/Ag(I) efflux system n=1 Tax=Salegentibacter flavus TaxID=287099 RepID=A0A1I5AGT3_9FLAO|nr:efflux RND transporter periplasmic adaptor subunit [Salegentibacter flavus]SFN61691.1 membrane fusion protein, Cu(I)/Ag(I) efflux system [Salegentibacter flavus]
MKTNNILKAIGILVIGILLGWAIFGGGSDDAAEHDHTEAGAETIWTCSMHPSVRQSEPGACPICGMDLIPLEEEETSTDPNVYTMSENALKLANVSTMKVGKSEASRELRLNGKVEVDERNAYSQSTHIPGRIEDLRVNFTGEKVNRGQTLGVVYSPELVTAQEELLQAYSIRESQPDLFEAAKEKLRNWKIGENQIQQILSNRKAIERFPITADVNGIVTEKMVDLGDYVERGMPIYEISDLSEVWVMFDLYESTMGWVNEGSEVEYSIRSLPGETFTGKISFVDPLLNSQTRVATARVEVDNSTGRLKPGMFASGLVKNNIGEAGSNEIVIPKSAALWTGKRSLVYIKEEAAGGAGFRIRRITLGPSLGDAYVVEDGLQVGDEIVVNGTFTVDAAVQLAGKPSMMNPPENEETPEPVGEILLSEEEKTKLQPVFSNYLSLKDALVEDDFKLAEKEAKELEASLEQLEVSEFGASAGAALESYKMQLENNMESITPAEDISALREKFDELSIVMIRMAQSFKPFSDKLYIQHCPMANSDRGADWLSLSEEIENPYYGSAMLTCGEVTEIVE